MRTPGWFVATLLVGLVGLVGAPAALAGPAPTSSIRLQEVKVASGHLAAVVDGNDLLNSTLHVRVDGRSIPATSKPVVGRPRIAVLVVDTSSSMIGERLRSATVAANRYLTALPADVSVGLVTFANRARLVVQPTRRRAAVRLALRNLHPGGGTAIYDAVDLAASVTPRGQLLVLTDGTDTVSRQHLSDVLASVHRSQVTVDVVGLQDPSDHKATSVQAGISAAGRGKTYPIGSAARAADRMHEVRIAAWLPSDVAGSARVTVVATGSGVHASTTATVVATGPVAAPGNNSVWLFSGIGAAFVSLLFLILVLVDVPHQLRGRRRMRGLVARYSDRAARIKEKQEHARLRDTSVARTALELANRVTARRGLGVRLTRKLQIAHVSLEPNEWLLTCLGVAVGAGLVVTLIAGSPIIGLLLGLVTGIFGPHTFLTIKARRRQAAFSSNLPDALQLMAGGLSSGYSLPQAIDSVVRLDEGPIAEEFGRALAVARLGTSVEDALDQVAERVDSVDFRWVVMAVRIQRQVGGNLSEILNQVAETIRERAWLRRHVAGLSAEGKLSAYILGGLPVVVGGYMFMVRRSYIRPLFTQPIGMVMLGSAVLLLVTGALFMRKLVKVEL